MKFCNLISRFAFPLSLIPMLLAVSIPSFASERDDDFKAAQNAANASHIEEAARLFCAVAKEDPAYHRGEAAQNCKIYQDQVNRENARNEERYSDGVSFFNQGQFDNASNKFRAIKSGPHLAEAQEYLSNKIPAAQQHAQAAGAESAMNAKFEQALQAFNGNAFSPAKNQFSQVTGGSHQAEAQSYLAKIQQYEQLIQQGDAAANGKNYKGAIDAYSQAANIKSDGPGDPAGKLSTMRTLLAATGVTPPLPQKPVETATERPPIKPPVVNAVVQNTKSIDVSKTLKEAEAARKKGDYGLARGKFMAVLAQDSGNTQANSGLGGLPQNTNQQAGAEADALLAKGIGEFYSGKFEDAEFDTRLYISNHGGKSALAHFYRAASKLTRYFLAGEPAVDRKLLTEAQDDFRSAKKSADFHAPEKMVSPKILKVFQETT